jgi:ElaB/YqjD/DUF883 family membrane-anchored ribosome-binding protein
MAEETKSTTNSGSTSAEPQNKVDAGKAHARRAADELKAAASQVAEEYRGRAEEVWGDARGRAEQAWGDAKYRARTFQEDGEQYIRENPTKAVFTALGIGFILGLIFRR